MKDAIGINEENEETIIPDSRSFFERTFGKLRKGALRGAIFALISTAIGAGCLTLPLVFKNQGVILGTFLLTSAVSLSYYSLISIALAAEKFKIYSYIDLTEFVLGKVWGFIIETSLILYVFGTIIGYQIMIGYLVPSILRSFDIDESGDYNRIIILCLSNFLLMNPLSMFKELTSLRFITILCAFSLTYISVLVVAEFPFFAEGNS